MQHWHEPTSLGTPDQQEHMPVAAYQDPAQYYQQQSGSLGALADVWRKIPAAPVWLAVGLVVGGVAAYTLKGKSLPVMSNRGAAEDAEDDYYEDDD